MPREEDPQHEAASAARTAVVWAGLALLCALLLAGWWAWRTLSGTGWAPGEDPAPRVADADVEPQALAAGQVLVRVVDVRDGAPLEGIEVELLSEEPVRRRFGRVASDARGRARFEGVLAPVALAYVPRGERFAAAVSVVRGSLDGPREALLRLSEGGELHGRVVDDLGAPVEGARITLVDTSPWPDPLLPAPLVALTDAEGGYRVERVVDLPRLVTAAEGDFFAAAMSQVVVEASSLGGLARTPTSVLACTIASASELILPRPPTFHGQVLDHARRPVAGALVSVHPSRQRLSQLNLHAVDPAAVEAGVADLPGAPRFQLLPGEALTGADGAFTLVGASQRMSFLVVHPDGRLQDFPLGAWEPGEEKHGLELVLAQHEVLRMRLYDPSGAPVLGKNPLAPPSLAFEPRPAWRISPIDGTLLTAWAASKVDLAAELGDGRVVRVQAAPFGDGSFHFALPAELSAIERLSLSAPGYRTRVRDVKGRLRAENAVASEVLEPLGTLAVTFVLTGELENPPGSDPQEIQIRACALEPQTVVSDPGPSRPTCCGVGMFFQASLSEREQTIAIPLLGEAAFWLNLRSSRGRRGEEQVAGPFTLAGGPQRIEIATLPPGPSPFERAVSLQGRVDRNAGRPHRAASLCVFDAQSGAALAGASVWARCDPTAREPLLGRTWIADEAGCALLEELLPGAWTFTVAAPGYRAASVGPLEVPEGAGAGGELDFGEVRLSPVD